MGGGPRRAGAQVEEAPRGARGRADQRGREYVYLVPLRYVYLLPRRPRRLVLVPLRPRHPAGPSEPPRGVKVPHASPGEGDRGPNEEEIPRCPKRPADR